MSDDANFEMMMQALAGEFLDESLDKLEQAEECLDNIRNKSGNPADNLLQIKRDIHSIKGGGIPYGFPTISKLCHGLEDYLETTSDQNNINVDDIFTFIDGVRSIVHERKEPDADEQEMLLKSMPSGRKQSGVTSITRGVGLLIMPKNLQRKVISQELVQMGFKLTLEDEPVRAIDTALVLKPDFVMVSMVNERLTGIEIVNMLMSAKALQSKLFAILSADDVDQFPALPTNVALIKKGRTFSKDLLEFIHKGMGIANSQQSILE